MEDLRSSRACCGLVPTAPTEDALRTIFVLSGRGDEVSTSALARHLGVAPPTVSVMLKRLAEHGLVERTPDHRASLTPHGAGHARHVVRRHRLLETFLVRVVGLDPHEVHDEADAAGARPVRPAARSASTPLLGHPTHDPHGDPIPGPATGRTTSTGAPGSPTPPPAARFRVRARVGPGQRRAALPRRARRGPRPGRGRACEEQDRSAARAGSGSAARRRRSAGR